MIITFLLPGSGRNPVGGYKVVYEYANGLAARGHIVNVVHPATFLKPADLLDWTRMTVRYLHRHLNGSFMPNRWFSIDPRVNLVWVPSLKPKYIPDADLLVVTFWQTAEWSAEYPAGKGRGLYLIQHQEVWSGIEDRVMATWRLPLRKVVIAQWLKDIVISMGENAEYIPNGLDHGAFGQDIPPEKRDPYSVLMMYHDYDWKGSRDGLKAITMAKERIPELRLTLFGVGTFPHSLPDWIQYYRSPPQKTLRELYNKAVVFVSPSWAEGWPLPPAEAMMCSTAVAATDIGGHREYACHEKSALLSPPKDPTALCHSLVRLLKDPELRLRIAFAGRDFIQQFTWAKALDHFEKVIQE
jgi:glycosyltransferase involved in cell wall biosynthesis